MWPDRWNPQYGLTLSFVSSVPCLKSGAILSSTQCTAALCVIVLIILPVTVPPPWILWFNPWLGPVQIPIQIKKAHYHEAHSSYVFESFPIIWLPECRSRYDHEINNMPDAKIPGQSLYYILQIMHVCHLTSFIIKQILIRPFSANCRAESISLVSFSAWAIDWVYLWADHIKNWCNKGRGPGGMPINKKDRVTSFGRWKTMFQNLAWSRVHHKF